MKLLKKFLKIGGIAGVLFGLLVLTACNQTDPRTKTIGIILPIEHKALDDIVAGFTSDLQAQTSFPLKFKVANAQGDLNLQRSILQQMKDANYDLIVPIGTVPTQMAANMIHQQPIVSLAAIYSQAERDKQKPCNITAVNDEIDPALLINFIHTVYPQITQITLVHSASDKIFPQIKTTQAAAQKLGIAVNTTMAATLNDLYSVASSLPSQTQAILVLKDNLIVSGIGTLARVAEQRAIPLITADQGSVQDGAAFSLGVEERDIGIEGAKLANKILNGENACALPLVSMQNLTIFVNQTSLQKEHQSLEPIQAAAKRAHYKFELVSSGDKS